jgi:hypothetical protein
MGPKLPMTQQIEGGVKRGKPDVVSWGAGLFPEFDMLEAYASKTLTDDYADMLEELCGAARLDGTHFFCRQESMLKTARHLAGITTLSLQVCKRLFPLPSLTRVM